MLVVGGVVVSVVSLFLVFVFVTRLVHHWDKSCKVQVSCAGSVQRIDEFLDQDGIHALGMKSWVSKSSLCAQQNEMVYYKNFE